MALWQLGPQRTKGLWIYNIPIGEPNKFALIIYTTRQPKAGIMDISFSNVF